MCIHVYGHPVKLISVRDLAKSLGRPIELSQPWYDSLYGRCPSGPRALEFVIEAAAQKINPERAAAALRHAACRVLIGWGALLDKGNSVPHTICRAAGRFLDLATFKEGLVMVPAASFWSYPAYQKRALDQSRAQVNSDSRDFGQTFCGAHFTELRAKVYTSLIGATRQIIMLKNILLLSTAVVAFTTSGVTFAWGGTGHRIVAQIAWDLMSRSAREEAQLLMAGSPEPTLPGIANWADEIRDKNSAGYHFVDFGRDTCIYQPAVQCPDGVCAAEGIRRFARELHDPQTPFGEKQVALRMLVHLVGDIHQPAHDGFKDDAGANDFYVTWQGSETSLHALWDTGLIRATGLTYLQYAKILERVPMSPGVLDPGLWAQQGCYVVRQPGFYPSNHNLGPIYMSQWIDTLNRQLELAGVRLAAVLNEVLSSG